MATARLGPATSDLYPADDVYARKSLADKMRDHYYGRTPSRRAIAVSDRFSSAIFVFTCVSEEFLFLRCLIPYMMAGYDPWTVYYVKLLSVAFFVGSAANWACVRCYDTSLRSTRDLPDLQKTLWDSHPGAGGVLRHDGEPPRNGRSNGAVVLEMMSTVERQELSWAFCATCQARAPPRSHHCKICQRCILKRDHHCYFTGVCVGYFNQRYFVVMTFYIAVASFWGMYFMYVYLRDEFAPTASPADYFLPFTWFRFLFGPVTLYPFLMIVHLYTLVWVGPMALGFFCWHLFIIYQGKTSNETYHNKHVTCAGTVAQNFRSVFGDFWALNFVMPMQLLYRQPGDGMHWHDIKKF